MKISKIQKVLVLVTLAAGMFAVGCELIVDFDRTKIPVEVTEAAVPDVNVPETTTPSAEAGAEGGPDADAGEMPEAGDAGDAGDMDADQ